MIAIAGGFLIAYLVAAFVFFPSGAIARDVKVPNVIGLDFETAQQRLRQAGFKAEQGESRFHAAAPKGTVLDQTPPAGSRDAVGAVVTLALSAGQKMGTVPNIVGLSRADAEHALEQAGFDVGDVTEQPGDQPRGTVVGSRPAPSSLAPSPGSVALVVSSGPNVVLVPDVVGRSFAQARQLLQQIGLDVGDVAADGGGNPSGSALVLSQSPAAGSQVASGSRISLRVGGPTE
ncbi:MAG TPA: PASTA domain-containing protein [Gemmatimonadaceae bacterium]|nr:PASTA domain-containing protein [Gemmatimonadaceae bacterium]